MDSVDVYPDIHGVGCSRDDYEEIALSFVDPKLWAREAALFQTKAWDYRFLHPIEATYLFAHIYNEQFALACHRRIDYKRAPFIRGARGEDPLLHSKAQLTGLIKARQWADEHGMPYDFHCAHALSFAEERDWRYLPKPAQLYSSKKSADETTMRHEVLAAWEARQKSSIVPARSSYYHLDNYEGTDLQNAHQVWLVAKLRETVNMHTLRAMSLIYDYRVLSPALYRAAFGEEAANAVTNTAIRQGVIQLAK